MLLTVLAVALPAWAQSGQAKPEQMASEKRVALVIGNGVYPTAPLRNPVNDARAMGSSLRELGFDVVILENLSQRDMRRAIKSFGDRLRDGGVGLFFFAGHGMQVNGRSYLIPVDADINNEQEVEIESVDVNAVLAQMETARNRLNIVVLDACRNNPYARRFRSASNGLAMIDAPTGTLIAYATGPGRVARDGDGANGVYTAELLKAVRTPGIKIEDVFKRVRQEVRTATRGDQVPWETSSLEGDFIFALPKVASVGPAALLPKPQVKVEPRQELGAVAIVSRIPGTEIWLGDEKLGLTRSGGGALVIENLTPGNYRVKARKPGYKDWEGQIDVSGNKQAEVVINLELIPAPAEPPVVKPAPARAAPEPPAAKQESPAAASGKARRHFVPVTP